MRLGPEARERFSRFDALLCETLNHTNLIARSSRDERWHRHYMDSAQLFDLIPVEARTLLDIGSGGGFPGIPLAIIAADRRSDLNFTLCESIGKKARFLESAKICCALGNLTVAHGRVEEVLFGERFDVVTARAVTNLDKLIDLGAPRLSDGGLLLLQKGRRAQQELDEARERWSFDVEIKPSTTDVEASTLLIQRPKRLR